MRKPTVKSFASWLKQPDRDAWLWELSSGIAGAVCGAILGVALVLIAAFIEAEVYILIVGLPLAVVLGAAIGSLVGMTFWGLLYLPVAFAKEVVGDPKVTFAGASVGAVILLLPAIGAGGPSFNELLVRSLAGAVIGFCAALLSRDSVRGLRPRARRAPTGDRRRGSAELRVWLVRLSPRH